jgi:hypothetical protein
VEVRRILTLLAAGLAGILVVAILRPSTFWTPDGADIGRSLEDAGDFAIYEDCEQERRTVWRCPVEDDPGSGTSGYYVVRMQPDDCWSAERGNRRLGGCVGFLDYVLTWEPF